MEKVQPKNLGFWRFFYRKFEQNLLKNLSDFKMLKFFLGVNKCDINNEERVDCGWAGIEQWMCEARGCCFDSTVGKSIWCFHTSAGKFFRKFKVFLDCI